VLTDEILENNIRNSATATIALDHHHLVRIPGVYVLVGDVADIRVCPKGAHAATTAQVTVDVLHEDVLCRTLNFCVRIKHSRRSMSQEHTLTVTHSSLFVTSTYRSISP
jgi:hypothetical protein